MGRGIFYVLTSALLLALPWLGGTSLTLLVAFVPLLMLQERVKPKRLWIYIAVTFALWWALTTWWVANAALIGAIASVIIGSLLTTSAFMIYHTVWCKARRALAYTIFVVAWISYEYLYISGEISFPWLTLGNGFANDIKLVQWYEYTGILGGSLWVLICNILIFKALQNRKQIRAWVLPALAVFIPIAISLTMYYTYSEPNNKHISVTVLQPNLDPYTEKFNMGQDEQNGIMLSLIAEAPKDVDFIVAPETAIDDRLWENSLNYSQSVQEFRGFLQSYYPSSVIVTGATTMISYPDRASASATARIYEDIIYDPFNSALYIDTTPNIAIHHKQELVTGVEKMPYYKYLRDLSFMSTIDLGGVSGQMGMDTIRTVFTNLDGRRVGTAICYESIKGECFSELVNRGAEAMFVITNDGWWGDSPGYRQHFAYSRLRAIETRRTIARSANTGISGFINQRGDVAQTLGWNIRGSLSQNVNLNSKITIYTIYGDYIGRLSWYILTLCLLYFWAYRVRKKSHLVE